MKLSTRAEYGLRAMFELARHYGQGPIPLRSIAEEQGISENYLEQLIAVLRRSGLVESIRGPQGGYLLAYPPEAIKVGDVVRVVEGPIAPMGCVNEDNQSEVCGRAGTCASRVIWRKVRDSINEVLDGYYLSDMVREAERLCKPEP
ncbi:MAG: RrF2 family transcriptional regulator [Bacillota bacterium]|jgi:Rrf2 family cysteine metabolism transcriptional repressor